MGKFHGACGPYPKKNIVSIVELVKLCLCGPVAVRDMSGEESCERISYGSRVGWQ